MAKSGNNGNGGNEGLGPGFSVSFNSDTGSYTPSGPTTPSWAPGNTPGGGNTNPAGLNNSEKSDIANKFNQFFDYIGHKLTNTEERAASRNEIPEDVVAKGDEAYTKARSEGKTEAEAQYEARKTIRGELKGPRHSKQMQQMEVAFEGKNTGPTYDPSVPARANTNKNIAAGSSEMGPSAPATAPADTSAPATAPADTSAPATSETVAPSVSETLGGASNTGLTYRGGTVTDSGTGGSISSSIAPPTRNASSIGLGVYNNDRANYDQDNWNRGMESESSSLVSDEECKSFAKRAFMENSEPFKKVRITIIKKC